MVLCCRVSVNEDQKVQFSDVKRKKIEHFWANAHMIYMYLTCQKKRIFYIQLDLGFIFFLPYKFIEHVRFFDTE